MQLEKSELDEVQQFLDVAIEALKEVQKKLANDPVFFRDAMDSRLFRQLITVSELSNRTASLVGRKRSDNTFNIQQG